MKLQALALAGIVALAGLAALSMTACAGGHGRTPDGASAADADAGGDGTDTEAGSADGPDGGDAADAAPKPAPVAGPASRLVVPGAVTLLGHGPDSCTNEIGSVADRWCAFARPAGDFFELWVLDVTKAAAGAAIACDGTDPSCLRVSAHLFKNRADGFAAFGFNGDTLIYGENRYPGDSVSPFGGVLLGWRPGLKTGLALTSDVGLYCEGQARSDAVMCFQHRQGDAMVQDVTVDLVAGHLGSVTDGGLPMMDTLLLVSTTDAPGTPPRVGFQLSPDGAYVAWSTRTATDPVETLHVYLLGDKGAPTVAAKNVSRWTISPDGAAWYWLAGYNYDVTGAPAGTLQRAPFPAGDAPTDLAAGVGDFAPATDHGLWLRTSVAAEVGTLQSMADRGAPADVTTVDTKVLTVLDHSSDGSRFVYAKTFAPLRPDPLAQSLVTPDLLDLYVGTAGGGAPCVVAATPSALHATMAPRGDLVLWDRYDVATGDSQGLATTVATCETAPFATRLASVLPAGEDDGFLGFIFLDDADAAAGEGTLRYARVVNGALVVEPPLQTRAARVFAPLPPALPAVVYTVETGTAADGLYLATLPAAPTNDGGAP
jgi:hypothetical protein